MIIVDIDLPYTRVRRKEFPTVEEAVAWIKANPSAWENDLSVIDMYVEPVYMDVQALVAEG